MRAGRRGNWKYLTDGDAQFMFDIDADIGERGNQFYRRPDVANELRQSRVAWAQGTARQNR